MGGIHPRYATRNKILVRRQITGQGQRIRGSAIVVPTALGTGSDARARQTDGLRAASAVVAEQHRRGARPCCRGLESHTDRATGTGSYAQGAAASGGLGEISRICPGDRNLIEVQRSAALIRDCYRLRAAGTHRLGAEGQTLGHAHHSTHTRQNNNLGTASRIVADGDGRLAGSRSGGSKRRAERTTVAGC